MLTFGNGRLLTTANFVLLVLFNEAVGNMSIVMVQWKTLKNKTHYKRTFGRPVIRQAGKKWDVMATDVKQKL